MFDNSRKLSIDIPREQREDTTKISTSRDEKHVSIACSSDCTISNCTNLDNSRIMLAKDCFAKQSIFYFDDHKNSTF